MGNRVYASHSIRIISGFAGLLTALLIISPLVANAASSSLITKRLCDRQSALGSRLIRFLIDPNICNPTAEPTVTLTADPTTIQEGNSSTLEWSSTNATSCTASNGWSGAKDVSGNDEVTPPVTTTYTLTCTGPGGSNSDSATVTVTAAPTAGHLIVDKVTQPAGNLTVFSINASGSGTITGGGASTVTDATSKNYEVTAGTYSVSETVPSGWTQVNNTCTGIVVATGATETCTITNAKSPTLTVVKVVVNNNGGTKQVADFPLFIDGSLVVSWATTTVATGTRTVSETNQTGYTATFSSDCAANGTITLVAGDVKTCTITNNDQASTLVVKKVVIRDNGGSAATTTFSFQVNAGAAVAFEADGQNDLPVAAGTYSVIEPAASGYTTTYENCTDVVIPNAGTATCTITNNDIAPAQPTLSLTADPTTLHEGSVSDATSTLTWDSTNADSCTASNGWTNVVGVDGSQIVQPTGTTSITYVLTCTGPGGLVTDDVTLTVVPPPAPTLTFSANPITVHEGSLSDATTTLTWDSTNATSCVASNASGWTGAKALDNSEVVTPLATSAYQLDCTGPGGTIQATTTVTFVPVVPNHLLISEVYYDVASTTLGTNSHNEWVEIFNPTAGAIDISGWEIADGDSSDTIPAGSIVPAGGYLVIAATSTLANQWSIPAGVPVIVVSTTIGGGLNDGGDVVTLTNTGDTIVDAVSWGTNTAAFSPSVPVVVDGNSIFRSNVLVDTNTSADWTGDATPSPGQ